MADLKGLIKLRRHGIDERQKALAELLRQVEALEGKRAELEETIERERQIAEESDNLETAAYFGRYAEGVKRQIERIDAEIKKLDVRIQIAQDDIRTAFAELKKIEIVQKNRLDKEAKERAVKETAELDDIAIEGFRRKEEV